VEAIKVVSYVKSSTTAKKKLSAVQTRVEMAEAGCTEAGAD